MDMKIEERWEHIHPVGKEAKKRIRAGFVAVLREACTATGSAGLCDYHAGLLRRIEALR